ncbi:MAG: hypothetical protein Q4B40_06555 [Clostridia bacterium]|nr:hypothetical protein [Clostridia bacterium]
MATFSLIGAISSSFKFFNGVEYLPVGAMSLSLTGNCLLTFLVSCDKLLFARLTMRDGSEGCIPMALAFGQPCFYL